MTRSIQKQQKYIISKEEKNGKHGNIIQTYTAVSTRRPTGKEGSVKTIQNQGIITMVQTVTAEILFIKLFWN
jgi:hypothetical protein